MEFTGLDVEFDDGSIDKMKVAVISALFDLPAKCMVQETVQFNGYFGCSCCEKEGENVSTSKKGSTVVFPQETLIPVDKPRSALRTYAQQVLLWKIMKQLVP